MKKLKNVKDEDDDVLNDSGIVEDITIDEEKSEYEKVRDENIKERMEMWDYLGLKSASQEFKPLKVKVEKRKVEKDTEPIVMRKSARIAAKENFYETILKDLQSEVEVSKEKPPKKKKRKLHNLEESSCIFNISFSAPDSSKKLFISYWS